MYDQAIINGRIYQNHTWQYKNIYLDGEKIAHISHELLPAERIIDVKGFEVLPGMIDPHVHFELDLGWIKSVDTFETGSRAALYGGVTSIIDFLEPTDHPDALEKAYFERRKQAEASMIDYTFHATIKSPKCDLEDYVKKMKSLGMHTLKLFTTYSDSNRRTDDEAIYELLRLSKKYHFLVLAHIENDALITLEPSYTYKDLLKSRPSLAETSEALKLASFVKETGGYLYMVHLSSGFTLEALIQSYQDIVGTHLFLETCPQYLLFDASVWNQDQGYLYTFAPPLRTKEEQELLKKNIGSIQTIGTDHCAFMKKDKQKATLREIPLGVGGIESSLSLMRALMGDEAIDKMSERVAMIQGLRQKGKLEIGHDADIIFVKPHLYLIGEPHATSDYSIYTGLEGYGEVITTMIRGQIVYHNHKVFPHTGRWIEGSDITF